MPALTSESDEDSSSSPRDSALSQGSEDSCRINRRCGDLIKSSEKASSRSDPGAKRRPMFNVGVHESEDEDDDADASSSPGIAPKAGRLSPSGSIPSRRFLDEEMSCPADASPPKRKSTVVRLAPLTVQAIQPGEAPLPSPRTSRFHSDPTSMTSMGLYQGKQPMVFRKPIVDKWRNIVQRALSLDDPWTKHKIAKLPTESCLRHRYSSIRKKWVVDRVEIKMQRESFARGAMRKCFRLKKLSAAGKFRNNDWAHALNYVAKAYIEAVDKETYFEDVKLQMDAKLWAEEYNRHRPPKKVDIFQISILEFEDEAKESRYYHLEHFIEGEYQKYNSNSGFVDEVGRQTPQAFSHFTFERSGHQQIVVDVQGVGDLYTDPQIHTVQGHDYGDGNLGTKGMALFFHSHHCNDICTSMGLTPFDLAPSENADRKKRLSSMRVSLHQESKTVCRGLAKLVESPDMEVEGGGIIDFLRHRTISERSRSVGSSDEEPQYSPHSDGAPGSLWSVIESDEITALPRDVELVRAPARRTRCDSELDNTSMYSGDGGSAASSLQAERSEREAYWADMRRRSRPAGLMGDGQEKTSDLIARLRRHEAEARRRQKDSATVLGHVHLDITRYHELGRFLPAEAVGEAAVTGKFDRAAAWFHLDMAAKCSVPDALLTCARIYLGLPHDILPDFALETTDAEEQAENEDQGLDYMTEAAEEGDLDAALFLAEAFRTGVTLGTERQKSYREAVSWLEKALALMAVEEEEVPAGEKTAPTTQTTPKFQIQATIADLLLKGGFELEKDPMKAGDLYNEAAEGAMEAGKGKLSTQFYAKSEEAWAEVPEDGPIEE